MSDQQLSSSMPLQLQVGGQALFTEQRIRLLEAIAEYGSLSAAAKSLPMSYKAAWDALDAMNNLSEQPLVVSQSGGRRGGGTQLTMAATQLIQVYRALQLEYQQSLVQLRPLLENQPEFELEKLRLLLRQMHFQSSARNQISGHVVEVNTQGVRAQVVVEAGANFQVKASVTTEAVSELMLEPGVEVLALIKAPQVKLYALGHRAHSNANYYQGSITRLSPDSHNCHVSVAIDAHKNLAALLKRTKAEQLELVEGQTIGVGFSPSAVVLCRYDA